MKKLIYIFFVGMLILAPFSCEPLESASNQVCDVANPLEDLPWLQDMTKSIQLDMGPAGTQIIQYTYQGNPVFWVDLCYQCPDGLIMVYNCAGEVICEFGGIDGRNTCIDFETEATDSTMLFQSFLSQ